MRISKKVKYIDTEPLRPEIDYSSPMHIQPPTFKTIADAYAHFTRHFDPDDFEDYEDDPDTPPETVEFPTGDTCDLLSFSQSSIIDGSRSYQPSEPTNDGQRTDDASEEAPATEDKESSSSTSE